jgi:hypothetical protein
MTCDAGWIEVAKMALSVVAGLGSMALAVWFLRSRD